VFLYSIFVKPIKLRRLIPLILLGLIAMTFIANARVTRTSGFSGSNSLTGFIDRGVQNWNGGSIIDLSRDFIVNNRNLYVSVDYVNQKGVNYGTTMGSELISIVPGLQSVSINYLGLDDQQLTTSRIINKLTLGENASWGIGTSLIGYIYMSF